MAMASTSACSRGATPSVFFLALFFVASIRSVFAGEDKLPFETWKFRDYEDYDIVKWGTQRGVCPRTVNFCGVEAEVELAAPALTPTREECVERQKGTTTLLNNILYKGEFCAIRCSGATDCAPDENCCADPCGTEICVKAEAEAIPRAERRCPGLLQKCPDNNERVLKCIRSDQFCNGVDDCGDFSDENPSRCQMQYVPVFEYGIQNSSSSICGCVYLLAAAFVLFMSDLRAF